MTYSTTLDLLKTKKEVLVKVNQGLLGVVTGAELLGITRQGFWKLRKRFNSEGYQALLGRKRGPKSWYRVHNRTPKWAEDKVCELWIDNHVGPDTYSPFVWFLVAYLDYRLLLVGGTDLMPWSVHRP